MYIGTYQDFINLELNPLTWYDHLPGEGNCIVGLPYSENPGGLAEELFGEDSFTIEKIDLLSASLLNTENIQGCENIFEKLSFKLSRLMSENLTASGSRILRMKSQRLVYYIQALLDRDKNPPGIDLVLEESFCAGMKPWDYLKISNQTWWISSGSPNIHFSNTFEDKFLTLDLPTQIDSLNSNEIVFGSIYTPGATIFKNGQFGHFSHDKPVVTVFDHDGSRYFLDHFSGISKVGEKNKILQVPCAQTHFSRYFAPYLYLMDNGDFGHITRVDMRSLVSERISVLPVQVCNDMALHNDCFFLIDKQQGSVFKFSSDWKYQSRALKFGKDFGCLQDPVSIRAIDGELLIVSWLTAKLTRMKTF